MVIFCRTIMLNGIKQLTIYILETPKRVLWQTMKTQMKCSNNAAFHQGLHCLLRLNKGTEICHNLENSTCDPLKYIMGNPILIASIFVGISTRIHRVCVLEVRRNFFYFETFVQNLLHTEILYGHKTPK